MRLQLIGLFLLLSGSLWAQSILKKELTISFKDASVIQCIHQLASQEHIYFSYNTKSLSNYDKRITKSYQKAELATVLSEIFQGTNLGFKEIGSQISIYEANVQKEYVSLSGYVRNDASLEEIIGAKIFISALSKGCISNAYGYYAINLPKGKTDLIISSVGFIDKKYSIDLEEDLVINFNLIEDTVMLGTVEVTPDEENIFTEEIDINDAGGSILTKDKIKKLPPPNGEHDLVKYAQQFPGIQPTFGGSSSYQVRGSGSGNNLILIDEIPVYHPTHLIGIYSVMNTDAIKTAKLYKDYVPASYGNRHASVLQINANDGDLKKFHFTGGLSAISLRMNLEGPIKKEVSSFYFSARNTTMPSILGNYLYQNQVGLPSFVDYNLKLNYKLNPNNRLFLTAYYGTDRVAISQDQTQYNWGNSALAMRWNHIFNNRSFSNLSLIYSDFKFNGYSEILGNNLLNQRVITPQIKYEISTYLNNQSSVIYGVNLGLNKTLTKQLYNNSERLFLNRASSDNGLYVTYKRSLTKEIRFEAGVRIPFYFNIGQQDTAIFIDPDYTQTTLVYEKNKLYDFSGAVDFRGLLSYQLNKNSRVDFSLGFLTQNIHMVNVIDNYIPLQIWVNSNAFLPPEHNYQIGAGYTLRPSKKIMLNTSVFAKFVDNTLDFASPSYNTTSNIEQNLLSGHIFATGFEAMVNYLPNQYYEMSLAYSYLYSRQKTPGVNEDEYYPTLFYRPHFFNFSQTLNLSKKWKISSNYILHSPTSITIPTGFFTLNGVSYPLYSSERNDQELKYYMRLDFSFTRMLGVKKNRDNFYLVFNIQNILGRRNPSFIYLTENPQNPTELMYTGTDFTPFMITATLNFRF